MGTIARFFGFEPAATPQTNEIAPLREAFGVQIDADDANYRRLSGQNLRELNSVTTERARQLATHLWDTNLLANRLIELPLAYLLAEGVKLECNDPAAQELLDAHWHDPINRWDEKLIERARDLALSGEQIWPVFISPAGAVRVAYLDPELVDTTICDPGNPEEIIGVKTKADLAGKQRLYRTIKNGEDAELFSEAAQEARAAMTDGECIYLAINRLPSRARGKSDLLASVDWLDGYDEFLFNELERTGHLRAFTWDVTLKGADAAQVEKRMTEIKPPKPGSANVHNDAEEWQAKAPTLNASDTKEAAAIFREHALGGQTLPSHWFGSADGVNKSTGESMTTPTLKVMTMRQRVLTNVLKLLGCFVLRQGGVTDAAILKSVTVKWPDLETKDVSRFAAAIQQVVAACAQALQDNLITHETGLKIIAAIAKQLQVDIDVSEELKKAGAAREVAKENDAFVPDPADVAPEAPEAQAAVVPTQTKLDPTMVQS